MMIERRLTIVVIVALFLVIPVISKGAFGDTGKDVVMPDKDVQTA